MKKTTRMNGMKLGLAALVCGLPLALVACDKETSTQKSSTTKVTETPEGTKKTTETVEKKVETEHKQPN